MILWNMLSVNFFQFKEGIRCIVPHYVCVLFDYSACVHYYPRRRRHSLILRFEIGFLDDVEPPNRRQRKHNHHRPRLRIVAHCVGVLFDRSACVHYYRRRRRRRLRFAILRFKFDFG